MIGSLLTKPLHGLFAALALIVLAMTAFVIFQPVQVVPRLASGPEYALFDQQGRPVDSSRLAGQIVLFGFGYTHDPTGAIDRTLEDMRRVGEWVAEEGLQADVTLALILYDGRRDTVEQRQRFAAEHGLDQDNWLLLGGQQAELKRVIGQGFGVYYEAVPLADLAASQPELAAQLSGPPSSDDYGYLQAQRYILVDERNIIRAEYRAPLDLDRITRDVRLIVREKDASGAGRILNEVAHLFLCYPS